jgi:hypothetical protein
VVSTVTVSTVGTGLFSRLDGFTREPAPGRRLEASAGCISEDTAECVPEAPKGLTLETPPGVNVVVEVSTGFVSPPAPPAFA